MEYDFVLTVINQCGDDKMRKYCDGEYERWSEVLLDAIYTCCPIRQLA